MLEMIRDGGAGTVPVIILGATTIVLAAALSARPSRPTLVLVIASALGTLLSGAIGTAMGIRNTALAHALADEALGFSLHPLILALYALGVAFFFATVGAYRLARSERA